jgi:hypothetical protein
VKPTQKKWIVPFAIGLAFVLIACSCSSLSDLFPGGGEAMPGLAGHWEHPNTGVVCIIEWGQNTYTVTSCIDDDGEILILTDQSWANGTLTWTMHVPSTGYDISFQTVRLQGDSLFVNRWGTAGSDNDVLQRVR